MSSLGKIEDLIKFYAFLTNLSIQYIGVMESDLKPDVVHTYLKKIEAIGTCDITYAIGSDERGESAINLSC